MIIRYRKRPLSLQKLDALISRLPETHPQMTQLRQQAAREQKGFNGERKLDYHLESLSNDYSVLHDVSFTLHRQKIQIDSLIITAQAIFIVEVKSYEGVITLDPELRHCFRQTKGKIERFKYPITQVETIQAGLLRLLQWEKLSGLPIYYLIAFAEKSTFIKVQGEEESISNIVMYVEDIPNQIIRINESLITKTASQRTSTKLHNRIVHYMMQHGEQFDKDVMTSFHIQLYDIQTGVHCPTCRHLGMDRKNESWHCPICGNTSKSAHLISLQHYYLLFGYIITNAQCRKFLHIKSRHTTKYLLQRSPTITKHSQYIWKINPDPNHQLER